MPRMATVGFTANVGRYVGHTPERVSGATVREALDALFALNPKLRGYILDDQGGVRTHVVVFVNGEAIADRTRLTDTIGDDDELFIAQSLSGG